MGSGEDLEFWKAPAAVNPTHMDGASPRRSNVPRILQSRFHNTTPFAMILAPRRFINPSGIAGPSRQ
jgi:hypothetical protein